MTYQLPKVWSADRRGTQDRKSVVSHAENFQVSISLLQVHALNRSFLSVKSLFSFIHLGLLMELR